MKTIRIMPTDEYMGSNYPPLPRAIKLMGNQDGFGLKHCVFYSIFSNSLIPDDVEMEADLHPDNIHGFANFWNGNDHIRAFWFTIEE